MPDMEKEWTQDSILHLSRYDLSTGTTETLYHENVPFYLCEFGVDDDRIIITESSDTHSLDQAYVLDLSSQKIRTSIPMEDERQRPGFHSVIDHGKIIFYSHPMNNPSNYRILIKNYEGKTVSDYTGENQMIDEDNREYDRTFFGADTENLFFLFKNTVHGKCQEWLMAYPIQGGTPKLVYTNLNQKQESQ